MTGSNLAIATPRNAFLRVGPTGEGKKALETRRLLGLTTTQLDFGENLKTPTSTKASSIGGCHE